MPTIGKTPIPKREIHDVLDSSKLQTFIECPRKYFFQQILGWQKKNLSVHLFFGSAWHEALEHLMNHGYDMSEVQVAYEKFKEIWEEEKPDDPLWEAHYAKNPSSALKGLTEYAEKWSSQDDFETLFTEVAGTVPIMDDKLIHWKVDASIKDSDGWISSLEHKTTGRNSSSWRNKWRMKTQTGTYHHALNALHQMGVFDEYDPRGVKGVKINGTVFRKNDREFLRIPVRRSDDAMQMWLWETRHYVQQLRWNMEELAECSKSDQVMVAFPRNAESCTKFGCAFPGLCHNWANPLRHCERGAPKDYEEDFWDPRRQEEEANQKVDLTDEQDPMKENEQRQERKDSDTEQDWVADKSSDERGGDSEEAGRDDAESETDSERGQTGGDDSHLIDIDI